MSTSSGYNRRALVWAGWVVWFPHHAGPPGRASAQINFELLLRRSSVTPAQHAPHPMSATFNDVLAVLAPPGGAHGVGEGIFGFLGMGAARPLRLVSKVLVSSWALPRAP